MINLIYGKDTYSSRQELKKIIEEHKKNNIDWFDFVRIDAKGGEAETLEKIHQSANTISMFNSKKLVIVENVFSLDEEIQEKIQKLLESKNAEKDQDTTIIFWGEEVKKENKLFEYLTEKAKTKEFKPLSKANLKNWVKEHINTCKAVIDNQALEILIENVGSDLWRMANEIDKLTNYSKKIKIEDVELLIRPEIDLNIFEMVDAIGYKNKSKAIKLFNQHLEQGDNELYLLSMFAYQIRNLIKVKSGGKLEMSPFVVQKTKQQAKSFNMEELKKIYRGLMTIDFDSKIGKTDAKTALELFMVSL
jgi:DNA polymerase-3 subunit delta